MDRRVGGPRVGEGHGDAALTQYVEFVSTWGPVNRLLKYSFLGPEFEHNWHAITELLLA